MTDVLINGPGEVWVDRGIGLERAGAVAPGVAVADSATDIRALAVRLASLAGRRLDDASPAVDARLPDGARLHAVLPPIADGCAVLSLRRVRSASMTWEDLVFQGAVHPVLEPVLRGLVHAKASVIVSGATGSGKTTLLATLLAEVDPSERIVLIEEAGEVRPTHPHVVRLVERPANVDGAGGIGMERLVREALRMRPDRIVLGECRGAEIREVLLALNTGHKGSLTTLHANAAADVPARLVALGALAGLSEHAVVVHAAAAFSAVIHVVRDADRRRVADIAILERHAGELVAVPAAAVDASGRVSRGTAWARLQQIAGLAGQALAEPGPPLEVAA